MTKADAAKRLRELANEVMAPWEEIHGLILEVDGSHNRIWGLGIKDNSIAAHNAMRHVADELEREHDVATKQVYIPLAVTHTQGD